MSTKAKKIRLPDTYLHLIHQFPLRPIRNDAEYDAATSDHARAMGKRFSVDPGLFL